MTVLEIILLAIGLAMDCFAISITNGIVLKRILWRPILTMAFSFGFFQALMPVLGWAGASQFSHLIESVDHWIAFGILAFLGIRMVRDAFCSEEDHNPQNPCNPRMVLIMSVATSIDALAVGVSFAFLGYRDITALLPAVGIIGLVSFILSMAGLLFGIGCGCGLAHKLKAELWGGIILIGIGTKILIEHLTQHYG